jgi:hypothetical protein
MKHTRNLAEIMITWPDKLRIKWLDYLIVLGHGRKTMRNMASVSEVRGCGS